MNKRKKNKSDCVFIEPMFDVIVVVRGEKNTNLIFQIAKKLEKQGLDVIAVYDNTCSIYGRCTQTTMGVLMAYPEIKSIEKNGYEN